MNTRMNQRLEALEKTLKIAGCSTCRDWPPFAVVRDRRDPDSPVAIPESQCPDCGRDARKVIVLERVDRGA